MNSQALDTPEAIQTYRIRVLISALRLEIKTGLRHSRNAPLKAAQSITGKKTRAACLAALESIK
jgi:hypothetical protein